MKLVEEIRALKKELNAVILVHNYQLPEVQRCADYLGDSLGLSIQAAKTSADIIVFCGVYFMAETAKVLSPEKTVLIPDKKAGCPMADMITAEQLRVLKAQHPGAKVLCYVNTSAEVKAECDLCCTSANAMSVVKKAFLPEDDIIFVPDKYLAYYTASQSGRSFITWEGYCPVHKDITAEQIDTQRKLHPGSVVIVHPECTPEVTAKADKVLSTEGMCRFVRETDAADIIVGTEIGMLDRLRRENSAKRFYPVSEKAACEDMKRITLEKLRDALKFKQYEVTIPESIRKQAYQSIRRMLDFSE